MLSYRHGYHAGNHADVLKHIVLMEVLNYFNAKEKPYWFIDTHAGAGQYTLTDDFASKNKEHQLGIERLLTSKQVSNGTLNRYCELVTNHNGDRSSELSYYPGSPAIAAQLLRAHDKIRLFDLHGTESDTLQSLFKRDRRVKVNKEDGFKGLKSLLPPSSRRAMVLIDPSYELISDYKNCVKSINDALTRFSTGTYLVWYPLLTNSVQPLAAPNHSQSHKTHYPDTTSKQTRSTDAGITMREALKQLQADNYLNVSMSVRGQHEKGMYGSGMFIINPPWTLRDTLQQAMPELVKILAQDEQADYTIDSVIR